METGRTREYGNVNLNDHAQAHLGDIHNHYHPQDAEKLRKIRESALLDSLAFDGMGDRARNVAMALPHTCQWILDHETFRKWTAKDVTQDGHSLFWIKGKPGSGKSTIMKEILEWAKTSWSTSLNLSFFFNARAYGELEKNGLGLYRSLVHQLLSLCSSLRPLFFKMFLSESSDQHARVWTSIELQNFLLAAIRDNAVKNLNVFIDALDEGVEDDVRSMLQFFGDLDDATGSNGQSFRLCLSSRHYPHISVQRGLEMTLEGQNEHTLDIKRYIDNRLKSDARKSMDATKQMLLEKSSGIFLWVVLVIPILKNLLDRGRSIAVIHAKLDSIPRELSELFFSILARNQDDFDECITLLQFVLYSMRPLHVVELYIALKSKYDPTDLDDLMVSNEKLSKETFNEAHRDLILYYILDCSRGLVEETKDNYVQFIHETVRTTLLDEKSTLSGQSINITTSLSVSHCHYKIAEICLDYLSGEVRMIKHYSTRNPMFLTSYIARYWWQHVSMVDADRSDVLYDIATKMLTTGSCVSILMSHFRVDRDNPSSPHTDYAYDPPYFRLSAECMPSAVYYAASLGIPTLVQKTLASGADVNGPGARFESALHAASFRGNESVVKQLLDAGANVETDLERPHGNPLFEAAIKGHVEVVRILIAVYTDLVSSSQCTPAIFRNILAAARSTGVPMHDPAHSVAVMLQKAIRSLSQDQQSINIRIKTMGHRWQTLNVRRAATGREIKDILKDKEWGNDQAFMLESIPGRGVRRFLDHWTLSDRDILDGDTFEMVIAYRAGCKLCPHKRPTNTNPGSSARIPDGFDLYESRRQALQAPPIIYGRGIASRDRFYR